MNPADVPNLPAAIEAVTVAAEVCRNVQAVDPEGAPGDVLQKDDRSPVTVADFASQAVVCAALHAARPKIPIVAEEDAAELRKPENAALLERIQRELAAVDVDSSPDVICESIDYGNGTADGESQYWTLDPIDGTKGFLRGEQYAISLALLNGGEIELAVLACPNLSRLSLREKASVPGANDDIGVLLFAVRGGGAWLKPLGDDSPATRVSVSATSIPADARFCESVESKHTAHSASAKIAESLGITAAPVRIDSQAKYAVVARGEADVYLRLPTKSGYVEKIWDHAGGVLIVEEAGGIVTDVDGQPLDWTRGQELSGNRGVVVSNGKLHDVVLAEIRKVHR